LLTFLLVSLLVAGCASDDRRSWRLSAPGLENQRESALRAQRTIAGLFPPQYRATHRAILTVGRKQFVCDGHLTVSTNEGWHLAVVSPLGLVAEVRVRRDGARDLLKVTPLLRAAWSRDFLARDLQWLFAPPGELRPAGRLADERLVFERPPGADGLLARYLFSASGDRWQELELSRQGRQLYHATLGAFRKFAGWPVESPSEIQVDAGAYRLHLRVVEMRLSEQPGAGLVPGVPNERSADIPVRSTFGMVQRCNAHRAFPAGAGCCGQECPRSADPTRAEVGL
jgi:hypothetical protein